MEARPPFEIEFYEDEHGKKPALDWIKRDLTEYQRRVIGLAMNEILQYEGTGVCDGEWGKALGGGLYEFRVRHGPSEIFSRSRSPRTVRLRAAGLIKRVLPSSEKILLRVFFHQHGDKLLILLSGYDKGRSPSKRRQQKEIERARARLARWRERQRS
jgi:putative component of toxin-antitoxin plasmid stabilization module